MHFNWWLEQHHSAWIWLRFKMEMALSLSKNQIHSILSYCAHAIPLLNMENKGLKKRGARNYPCPPTTLYFPYSANKLRWRRKNSSGWFERKTVSQKHHIQKNNASKLSTKDDLPVGRFVTSAMLLFPRNRRPARSLMMKTVFFFLTFPTCF